MPTPMVWLLQHSALAAVTDGIMASITPCTVHDGYLSLVSNVISIIANNVVFKI